MRAGAVLPAARSPSRCRARRGHIISVKPMMALSGVPARGSYWQNRSCAARHLELAALLRPGTAARSGSPPSTAPRRRANRSRSCLAGRRMDTSARIQRSSGTIRRARYPPQGVLRRRLRLVADPFGSLFGRLARRWKFRRAIFDRRDRRSSIGGARRTRPSSRHGRRSRRSYRRAGSPCDDLSKRQNQVDRPADLAERPHFLDGLPARGARLHWCAARPSAPGRHRIPVGQPCVELVARP